MPLVKREEIVDYQTYADRRNEIRASVMIQKDVRRIHVGAHLTFLFENHDTILYQVQEMMRTEQIVREADILHELGTYNELLGGPGELGATLLIEIESPEERQELLTKWLGLSEHLYAKLETGQKVYASYDPRQVGDTRLSSVQYLKFDTKGNVPVAIGCDFPELTVETELKPIQREALTADLD